MLAILQFTSNILVGLTLFSCVIFWLKRKNHYFSKITGLLCFFTALSYLGLGIFTGAPIAYTEAVSWLLVAYLYYRVKVPAESFQFTCERFGLVDNQEHDWLIKIVHRSGWFTTDYLQFGFGDLSKEDILKIATTLPPNEWVFILCEMHTKHLYHKPYEKFREHILSKATYAITSYKWYLVSENYESRIKVSEQELEFETLTHADLAKIAP